MAENELLLEEIEVTGPASKRKVKLPKVLTYDEIDRFLLAIDDIEDLIGCRVMLFGGLRVDEASSLCVRDISPVTRSIHVIDGKGGKERYAPVDVATIALAQCFIKSLGREPDDLLFTKTKRTLQNHVEWAAERAGLQHPGRKVTAHVLRHTCATWQLDQGIPLEVVRENLGHEDITTTQIYLHLDIRQRVRSYTDATRFGL